jgi:hypothetical protein
MKLKYYLRGMGIGIILTAIVMGFALGGRKATVSDAEVIERAKVLGMVDPTSGVLTQTSGGENNYDEANTIASGQKLDQKGEEVSQEVNEGLTPTSEYVSGLDETTQEGEGQDKTSEGTGTSENTKREVISTTPTRSPEGLSSSQNTNEGESTKKISDESSTRQAEEPLSNRDSDETSGTKTEEVASSKTSDDSSKNKTTEAENNKTDSTTTKTSDETTKKNTETTAAVTNGKTITIPKGMSSDSVAELLYKEGFVDSARSFNQYLIDKKMDRTVRSGVKTIPVGASYEEIANIICK